MENNKDVEVIGKILELAQELEPVTKDVITFQIKKGLEIQVKGFETCPGQWPDK